MVDVAIETPAGTLPDTALPEAFKTQPVQYLSRTRAWYSAMGYEPYRWPHEPQVPFATVDKPMAEARLALVTTAAPLQADKGDQGPGAKYNGSAKFFSVYSSPVDEPYDVRISHLGYDRAHTTAEDANTWFPLARLQEAVEVGRLGSLTPRFYAAPTVRSVRTTRDEHAPQIVELLKEDKADIALLVPT